MAIRRALVTVSIIRQQPGGGDGKTPGGPPPPRPHSHNRVRASKATLLLHVMNAEIWCYRCKRQGHLARSCTYSAYRNHCIVEGQTFKYFTVRADRAGEREQGNQDGSSRSGTAGPPPCSSLAPCMAPTLLAAPEMSIARCVIKPGRARG